MKTIFTLDDDDLEFMHNMFREQNIPESEWKEQELIFTKLVKQEYDKLPTDEELPWGE